MLVKQGFDWKKIERKPENWETLRDLIKDAYMPRVTHKDQYWDNETVLNIFVEMFPYIKEWVPPAPAVIANPAPSKKKRPLVVKKAQVIIEKQTGEIIRNDLSKIRIDGQTQMPIRTMYDMDITYVLVVLLWNYTFYVREQRQKNINRVAQLDAIVSLHRIQEEEDMYFTDRLRTAIARAKTVMDEYINKDMYDCLFGNPRLLIQSFADARPKKTVLYAEQHQSLNMITSAIAADTPLLLGNQMPTGTGKTFLSVPLAQQMYHKKLKKTVLFACSNELVNQDVASTALVADDLHLWLARLIRDDKGVVHVLLRPYKRCFPAIWKNVYKKDDKKKNGSIKDQWTFYTAATGRQPDMIIADLDACREILDAAGDLGNPFVAYIDEFISDQQSNRVMKDIAKILPRFSVIVSAILPQFDELHHMVVHFCARHNTTPDIAIKRVATANVNISCAIINHDGYLTMPHHLVVTIDDLHRLIDEIGMNPRIRRAYTPKHVYYWSQSVRSLLEPSGLDFLSVFPNMGSIRSSKILDYAITILRFLTDHFNLLPRFQEYRPRMMTQPPSFATMFTAQAHHYDGKTLVVAHDVYDKVFEHTQDLRRDVDWRTIVGQYTTRLKEKERLYQTASKTTVSKTKEGGKSERLDPTEIALTLSNIVDTDVSLCIPNDSVVNSREHVARYAGSETVRAAVGLWRAPIDIPIEYDDAFDGDVNILLSAGIGIYDVTKMTGYQRRLVMDLYPHLLFLCSGKEIVFGTNLPALTNIFIDASFGDTEHANTIYQLMGRAGRVGRSYHANIIVNSPVTLQKIMNFWGDDLDPVVVDFNNSFASSS